MQKKKNLMRSTGVFASMTMVSRLLGFARDMLLANIFGASAAFEAFLIALRIPSLFRSMFAEGAFAQAFVPILSEYQTQQPERVNDFLSKIIGLLSVVLSGVVLLGVLCSPVIVAVVAPGFVDEPLRFGLAALLLKITFPYLLLVSLVALASSVLNTHGVFGPPAFAPVFFNLSLIAMALLAHHFAEPVMALAFGVLLSGLLQLSFLLPSLNKRLLLIRPTLDVKDVGVQRVLKKMVPAMLGASVTQISTLLDTLFATLLSVGSVSWLYYSERLINLPLGVFGVAIATVIMPTLSRQFSNSSESQFSATLDWAMRTILLVAIPASIGLFLLAEPVVAALFEHGRFGSSDVAMTARSLRAFAIGLPAFMLIKVFASGFYGRQNIRTPVRVAGIALLINTVLNLILIWPLAHAGLALATSIAAYCNCSILYYLLRRRAGVTITAGWGRYLVQISIANSCMVALIAAWYWHWLTWFEFDSLPRIVGLLSIIAACIVFYSSALWLQGLRLHHFRAKFE